MTTSLTATQLRNARKRRARKNNHATTTTTTTNTMTVGKHTSMMVLPLIPNEQEGESNAASNGSCGKKRRRDEHNNAYVSAVTAPSVADSKSSCGNGNNKQHRKLRIASTTIDPSQRYSAKPLQAPIVQRAQHFFREIFHRDSSESNALNMKKKEPAMNQQQQRSFPIYVGSIYGWRTVVKLPVRYSPVTPPSTGFIMRKNKTTRNTTIPQQQQRPPPPKALITIGLFAPGSHQIVPIVAENKNDNTINNSRNTNTISTCICQTHHPKINQAIVHIQQVARSLQQQQHQSTTTATTSNPDPDGGDGDHQYLTAFSESTGRGYLRHIALSIQRHTNRIQLVLVWNSVPPAAPAPARDDIQQVRNATSAHNNDGIDPDISQRVLTQFVVELLHIQSDHDDDDDDDDTAIENDVAPLKWHSIWVHYNDTWKHANAIFTHDGVWNLLYHHQHHEKQQIQPMSGIDASSSSSSTSTNKHHKLDHLCPLGGVTEYLTTSKEHDDSYNGKRSDDPATNNDGHTNDAVYQLPHVPLHFPPQVFRQGNITAFTKIVQSIRSFIVNEYHSSKSTIIPKAITNNVVCSNRPSCLELYGGVGTIGFHFVDLCTKFVCSDENPYNVQCFNTTANSVLQSIRDNNTNVDSVCTVPSIRYESASAAGMVLDRKEHLNDVDIIIVDPPRKGMDIDVCQALLQTTATTKRRNRKKNSIDREITNEQQQRQQILIYVSCGFDAFVRDYQVLTQAPSLATTKIPPPKSTLTTTTIVNHHHHHHHPWNLIHAEGHVLFPGSDAIETLAIFTRTKYPHSK